MLFRSIIVHKPHTAHNGALIAKFNGGVSGNYVFETYSSKVISIHREVSPWNLQSLSNYELNESMISEMTYNGSTLSQYFNGVLEVSGTFGSQGSTTATFTIGSRWKNSSIDSPFDGEILEILIFDQALTDEERAKINYYLSKKWGLEDRVDSDGDGIGDEFEELAGSLPMDADSTPEVDLSDTVADQIGISSQLNSKEDDLKLWLDASNIDMGANASITDGDSLSQWIDLSGNGYHATQEDDGQKPQIQLNELNGLGMIQFDGSDDYFTVPKEMNGEYSFKLFMLVSFDINSIAGDNTFMMKGSSSYAN